MTSRIFFLGMFAAVMSSGPFRPAAACPVCFLLPQKTAADFLIESEFVVLARENPNDPFSFVAIECLKGHNVNDEYGLFVDSTTRGQLNSNPNFSVVLVRRDLDTPWHSLGVADGQFQDVVKRILSRAEQWQEKQGPKNRHKFFLPLLGSKNRTIFELAYLELGRAPYRTIKRMASFISPNDLDSIMNQREYFEWRGLAILMLAQNPDQHRRRTIEKAFEDCHEFSLTTNLAAWATAFIEIKGLKAITEIEEKYLRDSSRQPDEIRPIILALSVHSRQQSTELRERITQSYSMALNYHPQMTKQIVAELSDRQKLVLREQITRNLEHPKSEVDAVETRLLNSYIK